MLVLEEGFALAMVKGFEAYEDIGVGIPNPRSVVRVPIPEGLSSEQLAAIEAEIDRINTEEEAKAGDQPNLGVQGSDAEISASNSR